MDYIYTQADPDGYFIPKAQILGAPWVGNVPPDVRKLKNLGDYENLEIAYEIEESELEMNTSIARTIARTDITKKAGSLNAGLKQMSDFLRQAMYLGNEKVLIQADGVGSTLELDNIEVGDIIETGAMNITNVSIDDPTGGELGEGTTYDSGTHLLVDSKTGRVEILGLPADASGAGTLTYDAPEITAANKRKQYGLLTGQGIDMRIIVRQLHGVGDDIIIPKVRLRVDGNLALGQSGSEYANVAMVGKILSDNTQPADQAMGYVRTLVDHAPAV